MKKIILLFISIYLVGCNSQQNEVIDASGTLETIDVKVSSKISGEIKNIFVTEGASVKKGESIALVDSVPFYLQWKQSEAGVTLAKAQFDLLLKGARVEDLRQSEEVLRQAETNEKNAREDFERMKNLFSTHSIPEKQFKDAEARLKIAKAQLTSAREGTKKIKSFARSEDLTSAKARLEQAELVAELNKTQLQNATIEAPISGVITHLPLNTGEIVMPNGIICTISQTSELYLTIYVAEGDLGKIKINDTAYVVIDSYPDKKFVGRVSFISENAEFTPRNIQTKEDRTTLVYGVKINVRNENSILKSGMPADAKIGIKN